MYKDTNFVVVTSNLKVKCFGLISISTLYFVAIKNGAFYVLNTSIYKIFLSKFVKLISILDELNDFESFDLTLNDNNNLLELSYDKKLKLFTNKLTSSLNLTYQWFYHYENQWYKIDCNSNSLDIIPPVDDTFSIKLVAYTSIDGVDLKKESNIVNVIVYGPNIEVFLNDEYTFTKGDDIFVVPRIINMDLYKDEIKFKWVYLQNNEWLPFGLQNTNKLEIFDTPYNTNLLRIKLIVKVNNYTFESNESTIKIATIDTIIPNEINIYENDVVKIKPSITLINCDAKNLNYQWQLFNIEHNKWENIIGETNLILKFKANINANKNKYRLKIVNNSNEFISNISTVIVKENNIKISRVKSSYNIKEGATLSIVPELLIENGSIMNAHYKWQFRDGNDWVDVDNQTGKNLLINLVPIELSGTIFRLLVDINGKISSIETTLFVSPLAYISISLEQNEFDFSLNSNLKISPLVIFENCNETDIVYQWMIRYENGGWQNIKGAINKELVLDCNDKNLNNAFVKLVAWADGRYFESNLSKLIFQSINLELNDHYEVVEKNNLLIIPNAIDLININENDVVFEWESKLSNGEWIHLSYEPDLLLEKVNYDFNFLKIRFKAILKNSDLVYYSNEATVLVKENDISIMLDNDYFFKEGDEFIIKPSIKYVNDDQQKVCSYQWQYKNQNGEWVDSDEYKEKEIALDYTSLKWDDIFIRLVVSCLGKQFYSNKSLVHVSPSGSVKITFNEYEKSVSNYSNFSITPTIELCDVNDEENIRYQWQFKYMNNSKWTNINNQNDKTLILNNFVSDNNAPFDLRLTAIIDKKLFISKSIRVKIID